MTSSNKENEFDQWAQTYDTDVADDGLYPFDGHGRILQRIVDLAEVESGTAVLELGVGTGNLTKLLSDRGADVWGVDFSNAMLAAARTRVPAAHLAHADLLQPLPQQVQQRFPVLVSSYVFHEFPTAEKITLLKRLIGSHLLPGGCILIGDIGFPDAAARQAAQVEAGDRWSDKDYWIANETAQWAADNGLEVEVIQVSSCGVVVSVGAGTRSRPPLGR